MGITALQETKPGAGPAATDAHRPATNQPSTGSAASEKEMMAAPRHPTGDPATSDADASSERPRGVRVTLRFDAFAWGNLESAARRDGETLDDFLTRAVLYFDGELPATRVAMSAPLFKPEEHGDPRDVVLAIPVACRERMQAEATRQGVPLGQLYEHAALVYLADIDAGRVADRVLERAEETEDDAAG